MDSGNLKTCISGIWPIAIPSVHNISYGVRKSKIKLVLLSGYPKQLSLRARFSPQLIYHHVMRCWKAKKLTILDFHFRHRHIKLQGLLRYAVVISVQRAATWHLLSFPQIDQVVIEHCSSDQQHSRQTGNNAKTNVYINFLHNAHAQNNI